MLEQYDNKQWHNQELGWGEGEGLDKISRRAHLLSFPYPSPPIPFKGLPPEILMLAYGISRPGSDLTF